MTAYEVQILKRPEYIQYTGIESIWFEKLKDAKGYIEQNAEKLGNCFFVYLINHNTRKLTKVQFVSIHENGKIWTEVYKYKCVGTVKTL